MATLYKNGHDKNISGAEIAANSLVATFDRLIAIKAGYANLAVAGDVPVGISTQDKTFASDNVTVAKSKLTFVGLEKFNSQFKSTVSGGTIAQANVGSPFDLDVDGLVAVGAAGTTVKLEKVLSTTEGAFSVIL